MRMQNDGNRPSPGLVMQADGGKPQIRKPAARQMTERSKSEKTKREEKLTYNPRLTNVHSPIAKRLYSSLNSLYRFQRLEVTTKSKPSSIRLL